MPLHAESNGGEGSQNADDHQPRNASFAACRRLLPRIVRSIVEFAPGICSLPRLARLFGSAHKSQYYFKIGDRDDKCGERDFQ
jgi:hypothetical protein